MRIPNIKNAVVVKAKLVDYLLSFGHPTGRHKAKFFEQHGFTKSNWQELENALREHASAHDASAKTTIYGTKYVVDGPIRTSKGTSPEVRSVWFSETGEDNPRFVTVYPL